MSSVLLRQFLLNFESLVRYFESAYQNPPEKAREQKFETKSLNGGGEHTNTYIYVCVSDFVYALSVCLLVRVCLRHFSVSVFLSLPVQLDANLRTLEPVKQCVSSCTDSFNTSLVSLDVTISFPRGIPCAVLHHAVPMWHPTVLYGDMYWTVLQLRVPHRLQDQPHLQRYCCTCT